MAGDVAPAFAGVAYTLSALYICACLWSLYSLMLQASVSRAWTGQKSIHAYAAVACGLRAAFFAFLPSSPRGTFLLVQISSEDAPLWLAMADAAPAALEVAILCVLALAWARAWHASRRNEAAYARGALRAAIVGAAILAVGQIVIWALFGHLRGSQFDALPVAQACLYCLAFAAAAAAMLRFGARASAVVLGVAALGLSSRTLLSRTIMQQAVFCAAAYLLRAAASLGVAVAVATGLDQRFDVRDARRQPYC